MYKRKNFSLTQNGVIIVLAVTCAVLLLEYFTYEKSSSCLSPQLKHPKVLLSINPTIADVVRFCSSKCQDIPQMNVQETSVETLNYHICNITPDTDITITCHNMHHYNLDRNWGRMNFFVAKYLPCTDLKKITSSWGKCAIVGSSGSFKRIPHGKEIDGYDTIIRFNTAPTKGYEDLVGSRTDIRIINHLWVTGFSGNLTWSIQEEDSKKLLRYRTAEALYKYHDSVTENFLASTTLIDHRFMNVASDCLAHWEDTLRSKTNLADHTPQGFRSPTTGFFSMVLASHFCHEIHVYGFRSEPTDNYHYYGPKESYASVRGISHNFDLETVIFGYWENHMDNFKVVD